MKIITKQKPNEIKVAFDIFGNLFVVEACDTNGTMSKQSDKEFLVEMYQELGYWEEVLGEIKEVQGVHEYTFTTTKEWNSEHTECEVYIHCKLKTESIK